MSVITPEPTAMNESISNWFNEACRREMLDSSASSPLRSGNRNAATRIFTRDSSLTTRHPMASSVFASMMTIGLDHRRAIAYPQSCSIAHSSITIASIGT